MFMSQTTFIVSNPNTHRGFLLLIWRNANVGGSNGILGVE